MTFCPESVCQDEIIITTGKHAGLFPPEKTFIKTVQTRQFCELFHFRTRRRAFRSIQCEVWAHRCNSVRFFRPSFRQGTDHRPHWGVLENWIIVSRSVLRARPGQNTTFNKATGAVVSTKAHNRLKLGFVVRQIPPFFPPTRWKWFPSNLIGTCLVPVV